MGAGTTGTTLGTARTIAIDFATTRVKILRAVKTPAPILRNVAAVIQKSAQRWRLAIS
jgi:hypothetical protein